MADETNNEKPTDEKPARRTVPAMTLGADGKPTAQAIAAHAEAVYEMQYDRDRKAMRDPLTCMVSLFHYARLTAARLAEAEGKLTKLEGQFAEFVKWRVDMERQANEFVAQVEKEIGSNPEATKLRDALVTEVRGAPALKSLPVEPPIASPPLPSAAEEPAQSPPKAEKKPPRKGDAA